MEEAENKQETCNKNILHFGCKIYICFCTEDGSEFYTSAEGFTKSKVRLKTKQQMDDEGDFTSGLFKVYPSFYESEYRKTKQKYEEKKQQMHKSLNAIEKREARSQIPKQVKAMEEESSLNYDQYEKLKGTPILYGQTIQLLHVQSNKFLFYDLNNVSDYDPDNLKIGLKEDYSDETQFKFLPCFSYQQESQGNIFNEDIVYIVSNMDSHRKMVGEPYVHASKPQPKSVKKHDGKVVDYTKREMNVSTDKKSNWKIKIFCEYIDEKKGFLSVTDIIWINFSESDLNLIAQKSHQGQDEDYEDEKYKVNPALHELKFESCETSEKYKKFIGNSNGMFIVESENMSGGGLVEWDNQYRLKHLTTNFYLALGEDQDGNGTSEQQAEEKNRNLKLVDVHNSSLFQFELIFSTLASRDRNQLTKFLQKDSYFRLKGLIKQSHHHENNKEKLDYWLKTAIPGDSDSQVDIEGSDSSNIPMFSTVKKEENVFKLAKANINEVRMTSFLLSCMKTIRNTFKFLNPSYWQKFEDNNNQQQFQSDYKKFLYRIGRLEKCLIDLNLFCHNKLQAYLYIDQDYNTINSFIQNVLREQLFIELLVKLLAISFPTIDDLRQIFELENKEKTSRVKKQFQEDKRRQEVTTQIKEEFVMRKKKVCNHIYILVNSICKNNLKNQEKSAMYLPLFAMHSKYIPSAMDCIIQIISDYEEQLLTLRNEGIKEDDNEIVEKKQKINKNLNKANYTLNVEEHYKNEYNSMIKKIMQNTYQNKRSQWDLILFFSLLLKEEKTVDIQTKRELLKFLGVAATFEEQGVNVNQEGIYSNLISNQNQDQVYENNILLRIKSDGPMLIVFINNEQKKLMDIVNGSKMQKKTIQQNNNILGGKFADKNDTISLRNQQQDDANLLMLIQDQINFFSYMCNSRNYTWKKFVEKSFNFDSLLQSISNKRFSNNIRAIICHLLNKLYVDQEPRRVIKLPELCKVVQTHAQNDSIVNDQDAKDNLQGGDQVNIKDIKGKIKEYITGLNKIIEQLSDLMGDKSKKEAIDLATQEQIMLRAPEVYNDLTYEMIKLLKLLIDFGSLTKTDSDKSFGKNEEFFQILKSLIIIFEFDKTYPEARKILLEKRKEGKKTIVPGQNYIKGACTCITKIFNMFNILNLLKTEEKQKPKKKKLTSMEIQGDDMGISESFMMQTDVLRKILSKFYSDDQDEIEFKIKQEICDILNKYLDYKHNSLLNNLKDQFKDIVVDKQLKQKAEQNTPQSQEAIKKVFQNEIQQNMKNMIPVILTTGTAVDDTNKILKKQKGQKGLKSDTINISNILQFDIFPSLMIMFCLTQNIQMEQKILSILCRFYNQRNEFAQLASDLLILFDDKNIKVLKESQRKMKVLAKNVDESETWVKDQQNEKNTKILKNTFEQFQFFTEILLQGSHINNDGMVITEQNHGKVDPIRQEIVRHINVYKLAISLIKENINILNDPVVKSDQGSCDQLKKLFKQCFEFLKNFVLNNTANQNILSEYLVALLVGMEHDLGQVDLFCEIFRDNKKICLEKHQELTDDFIRIIESNGRQAKFIEFFVIIQRSKDEFLLQNQKHVLNLFLDIKNKKNVLYLKDNSNQTNTNQKLVFNFHEENEDRHNPNYKDEPYTYHAIMIQCLATTTIGKEGMYYSESKLRQNLHLKYMFELLHNDDSLNDAQDGRQHQKGNAVKKEGYSKLKLPLLQYIYYTFLESEKISEEFQKDIEEFVKYIKFEIKRFVDSRNPTPLFQEYLFEHFLFIINAYLRSFSKEMNQDQKSNQNTDIKTPLIEFKDEIEKKLNDLQLTPRQEYEIEIFNLLMDDQHDKAREYEQQQNEKQQFKEFWQYEIYNPKRQQHQQNNQYGVDEEQNEDKIWKNLWDLFLDELLNSDTLKEEIDNEHMVFAEALDQVEKLFAKDMVMSEIVNKTQIFSKLIKFLQKSHGNEENITTFKLILNALGNYINIQEDSKNTDLDKEDLEALIKEEKENHQNFLNINGAVYMILSLLSDYSNPKLSDEVFNDLVAFGIQILDEGNREVQKSVYSYFHNFTSSEVFFMRIHQRIEEEYDQIKREVQREKSGKTYKFEEEEDSINNILRLLQLFAEGHYLELQDYMRQQDQNYHNYDLIQAMIELLNTYFKFRKQDYIENMMQCFDCLTEYIQGPCQQNQIALIQDNFLDLSFNLLNIDEIMEQYDEDQRLENLQNQQNNGQLNDQLMDQVPNKKKGKKKDHQEINLEEQELLGHNSEDGQEDEEKINTVQQNLYLPKYMIARLKYKCSVTLISLLEARKDNEIVQRMMKSLTIEVLKRNIIDSYILFEQFGLKKYNDKLFLHFNDEVVPGDKRSYEKCAFIIETGFNLFIVFSNFMEASKDTDSEDIKVEEDSTQNWIKQIEKSIVGKLIKLSIDILHAFKRMVEQKALQMKSMVEGKKKIPIKEKKEELKRNREDLAKTALKFFSKNTLHIEVLREDKQIEKAYFYCPPFCRSLDKDTKTDFNRNATRISPKSKVTSLIHASKDLIKTMKHNFWLNTQFEKVPIIAVLAENIVLLRDVAFLLAIAINIMVLLSYKYYDEDENAQSENRHTKSAINGVGTVVIVLSSIIVSYNLLKTGPILMGKAWAGAKQDQFNIFILIKRLIWSFIYLLSDFYVLYYIIYAFTAIIGLIISPFFFFFHLFDVLVRYPVLLNVVLAVWKPKKQILFTYFLFIVLMYVFTLFGYYWLRDSYPSDFCESTWICLVTAIDKSFKADGGLGGFLTPVGGDEEESKFLIRFFFDNIYFILLMIIMINIVSGIIIDTFGNLREELMEYEEDLSSYCFICGHNSEHIEKNSENAKGFKHHIKNDHYMWNYLFYIAYLFDKDDTEYTGIESYVADKLEKEEISWFPTYQALCLKPNTEKQEAHDMVSQLDQIQEDQQQLQSVLDQIDNQIDKIENDQKEEQYE